MKKKSIAILGSTGSIGKSLLNIIRRQRENFEIILLTANKNYIDLLKQTNDFNVKNVIILNKSAYEQFKKRNKHLKINIYNNFNSLETIFNKKKVDYTMSSIVGLQGLEPTLKIIKFTKTIAVANKESIICGWNLIRKELTLNNTNFIPVDSEHYSIWYAIKDINISHVQNIFLTASGGPLLNLTSEEVDNVKINQVLKHPNWKMGKKITIDSATMMNKVFEVIEAKNIFNIDFKKLNIIIHPQSFIHSIIYFVDGMIKIIAHKTTMEIPIQGSLLGFNNIIGVKNKINLNNLNNLKFIKPNNKKFPLLNVLKLIPNKISLYETVLISANDEIVNLYLNKKIKYKEISKKIIKIMNLKEFKKFKNKSPKNIGQIIQLDKYVRFKINSKSI